MKHPSIESFWTYVEEREAIRLRRAAGESRPWTQDLVLQSYRFCNIRRADDYGTKWFREQERGWMRYHDPYNHFTDRLWRTILYRSINNVSWFEELPHGVFSWQDWDGQAEQITEQIAAIPSLFSPAYLILSAANRESRKTRLVRYLAKNRLRLPYISTHIQEAGSLEEVWKLLCEFDGVGYFIAMQIYRDLILIGQLPFTDNDFAYMGPGAQWTLKQLLSEGRPLGFGPENSYYVQNALCQKMWEDQPEWLKLSGLRLSLCDVQHNLCEYGKWLRLRANKGKRRLFTPREDLVSAAQ